MNSPDYPDWICHSCGSRIGNARVVASTYHTGVCGWCGKTTPVTQPRDFSYPLPPPKDHAHAPASM